MIDLAELGVVEVTKTPDGGNDPAWWTMRNLKILGRNPGPDEKIAELLKLCFRSEIELGTVYANPLFRISAKSPSQSFVNKARWAQGKWRQNYCEFLCKSSGQWKRVLKASNAVHPLITQLTLTGVMVMNNRHVHPKSWQHALSLSQETEQRQRNLVGRSFGRLLVLEQRAKGKWFCRCACGTEKEVRGNHLRSGRTISCGCRIDEIKAHHERKRASQYR